MNHKKSQHRTQRRLAVAAVYWHSLTFLSMTGRMSVKEMSAACALLRKYSQAEVRPLKGREGRERKAAQIGIDRPKAVDTKSAINSTNCSILKVCVAPGGRLRERRSRNRCRIGLSAERRPAAVAFSTLVLPERYRSIERLYKISIQY